MFRRKLRKKRGRVLYGVGGGGGERTRLAYRFAAATTTTTFIKYKFIEITRYFHYNLFNIHYTQANKFARGKYFGSITQRS